MKLIEIASKMHENNDKYSIPEYYIILFNMIQLIK